MRVTAEMTRYLATSGESQSLPLLTPRIWEISSLGQSKEWEDKELNCPACVMVCGGVRCVVACGWVMADFGQTDIGQQWGCDRLWPDRLWPEFVFYCFGCLGIILLLPSSFLHVFPEHQPLTPNPENLHTEPQTLNLKH